MRNKAIELLIEYLSNKNFLVGTDNSIGKSGNLWKIYNLEGNCWFYGKDLEITAGLFVDIETPEIIIDILESKEK